MQPITFSGWVEKGEGMAASLGCPTANVAIEQGAIIPALGVYVGLTDVDSTRYPSLVCISDGRTGYNLKMEVHLLDQKGIDLTGVRLEVVLLHRLRDIIPFPGEKEMAEIIIKDLVNAKDWFSHMADIPQI